MSDQTETLPVAEAPAKGESRYVVQVAVVLTAPDVLYERPETDEDRTTVWQDVATVVVPARSRRKTIIAKALTDAGIKPDPGQPAPRVRVLDEESACVHEPGAVQPPAEWVVS